MKKTIQESKIQNNESINYSLIEALSFSKKVSNPRFSFCCSQNLVIATFITSEINMMLTCEHSHDAYEFLIPHTPLPYLTNDGAVYFGEVGNIYPVQSGRKHGVKYSISNVGYTSISVDKEFFENILKDKGYSNYAFNSLIPCSETLVALIKMFKREFSESRKIDINNKIEPLTYIICAEIIDLAANNTNDDRKSKTKYQKGIRLAADYINEHFAENISIESLACLCGLSLNYFSLSFRNAFGETPKSYITKMRISKAKTLLEFSDLQIKEISKTCGFQKFNSFTCSFKKYTGMTPSEYRNKASKENGGIA